MEQGTYNLPDTVAGDTFDKLILTITDTDITGWEIKAMFKRQPDLVSVKTIEIGTGITVTDAANGIFEIDSFIVALGVGVYYYDIQFTDTDGNVYTYVKGTFEVLQQITT